MPPRLCPGCNGDTSGDTWPLLRPEERGTRRIPAMSGQVAGERERLTCDHCWLCALLTIRGAQSLLVYAKLFEILWAFLQHDRSFPLNLPANQLDDIRIG